MEMLYSPARAEYFAKKLRSEKPQKSDCPFCLHVSSTDDQKALILERRGSCVTMLNLYPYNDGHLMVIPYNHQAKLNKLSDEERNDIMESLSYWTNIAEEALKCDGVNIGLNQGKASGGSVSDHLHFHIVPRYVGDAGFLAIIAETKPMSAKVEDIYQRLLVYSR